VADLGSYGVDFSRALANAEPLRVFATGARGADDGVEVSFVAVLEFPGGVRAIVDGGFDRPRHNVCEIVGAAGSIVMTSPFVPAAAVVRVTSVDMAEERSFSPLDTFQLEFEHFSSCVLDNQPLAVDPENAVANARVLAALRESLDSGVPVRLGNSSDSGEHS
jgi:predicted dehydrogenase